MTTQRQLGRQFAHGFDTGSASNVRIVETKNGRAIIGYGHAVYFETQSGTITYYAGWYGHSSSTSGQLTRLRSGMMEVGVSIEKSQDAKSFGELEL